MGFTAYPRGNLVVKNVVVKGKTYLVADLEGSDLGPVARLWSPTLVEITDHWGLLRGFDGEFGVGWLQEWEFEPIPEPNVR